MLKNLDLGLFYSPRMPSIYLWRYVCLYIFTYFPIGINGWSEVWLHYASNGQDTFYMEAIDGPLDGHCTNNNV